MFLTESRDKHFIFGVFKNWVLDKVKFDSYERSHYPHYCWFAG